MGSLNTRNQCTEMKTKIEIFRNVKYEESIVVKNNLPDLYEIHGNIYMLTNTLFLIC